MASLTREEAQQRSALVEVTRYDVRLDLRGLLDGHELRSATTITFGCAEPGASTFVDVVAEQLHAVRLNGSEVTDPVFDGERLVVDGLSATNVLEIETSTTRTSGRAGIHRAVDPHDDLAYVWTTFEADDARRVFGCFDQPDLKAVFGFTVVAPRAWTVVSNSPAVSREATEDGVGGDADVWVFADTPRLSTYVTVVCAGPFHEVSRDTADHELRLLARASLATQLDEQAGELFDLTEAGLAWFGQHFAMPFPQRAYTQVFCPDFQGAMENYGCVTWTDSVIHRSQPTADQLSRRAVVLLHEMAHMWFGDIVTMRWWDDLWLNESFADWAAHWAAAAATRYTSAWADFTSLKERGYLADRAPTTHPIRQDVPDVAAAMASFDMITYAKGASVLQQLGALVGEEAFVAGLVRHFAAHAWGNATLEDLLGSLEQASGRDLSRWSATWLQTAGASTLAVQAAAGDEPAYTEVLVHQSAPDDPPTLRLHRVDLGVYDLAEGSLRLRTRHVVETDAAVVGVDALAGQPVADLLLLNDTDRDFARTPLDERSRATALQHGHTLDDAATRALLRLVLWHEVDDGRLPAADAVRFALRSLPGETEAARVDALVAMALEGSTWWTGEGRAQLQAEVSAACLERANTADPQARATLLQAAASTASPSQVAAVRQAAADSVPAQWLLLVRRSASGEDVAADVTALLAADPDPDAGSWQVAVRAAAPDAAAKEEVFDLALVRRQLPSTALSRVGAAFWQPGQDELLEPFARRFTELLPTFGTESLLAVGAVLSAFFPRAGVDDGYPAAVAAAAAAPGVSPVVSTSVRARADVLARMLRARSLRP